MHTLGSHKSWSLRRQLTRRVLQAQVLRAANDECAVLSGKWHCGPNPIFSACWEHYGGNFWRASCSHVNTLQDPSLSMSEFERAMHMGRGHGDSRVCTPNGPLGRYWAEAWIIHGHANVKEKLQINVVTGRGGANVFAWLVHETFFKRHINLVSIFDFVAYIFAITW